VKRACSAVTVPHCDAGLMQLKDKFKEGDVVVIILHDHGSRYLAKIYNDDWMRERGFLTDEVITAKNIIERKQIRELIFADPKETVVLPSAR